MSFASSKSELLKILHAHHAESTSENLSTEFYGIEFDSRRDVSGKLFVCLPGEKIHGHQYIDSALSRGATLCLVEDKELLNNASNRDKLLYVDNTLLAMQSLAIYVRNQFKGTVIGVTGTVGKTTTRNILASILSEFGSVNASEKSFNNHIGVPYTICNANLSADYLVLEMGMNHAGEMRQLSKMASPNIAVITNVTPVHMEFFNSLAEVADAKCEIFDGLTPKSTVLINNDCLELNEGVQRWLNHNKSFNGKVIKFGTSKHSDYLISHVNDRLEAGFDMEVTTCHGKRILFSVPLIGSYNSINIIAAVAALFSVEPNFDLARLSSAVSRLYPEQHRLSLLKLKDGSEILDDCYNSSPEALHNVLELVKKVKQKGKSVGLVLGGMHELGSKAEELHADISKIILGIQPKFCFFVGDVAKLFLPRLSKAEFKVEHLPKPLDFIEKIRQEKVDFLLVKGSRAVQLDLLIKALCP